MALIATEAANNLVQHAAGGELVLRVLGRDQADGLEILSLDKGPGMRNVAECLRDGFSTAGTPGTGLGAILRLSDLFDIYSLPGMGIGLAFRLRAKAPARPQTGTGLEIGAVCLPKPGETVRRRLGCGRSRGRSRILVADGLGHGPAAAEASGRPCAFSGRTRRPARRRSWRRSTPPCGAHGAPPPPPRWTLRNGRSASPA